MYCLQALFEVSSRFTIDLHRAACERSRSKTQLLAKKEVVKLKLGEEDVLRPEGSLGSLASYLQSLSDEDKVTVVSQKGKHGLAGKQSNNSSSKERALFIEFVKEHRAPTGRTRDATGRYHGAEHYMHSKIQKLKTQVGRDTPDPTVVLESVFRDALEACPGADFKAPSGSTISTWFNEDFGIRSEHGHTTLFPHKTDACAICSSFDTDISSVAMSITRHKQQTQDAGSLERQVRYVS